MNLGINKTRAITTLVLIFLIVISCSGGGGGDGNSSESVYTLDTSITPLAKTANSERIFLSDDRIFFSDYNRGELYSVPKTGGEITCHLNDGSSIWDVVVMNGRIFAIITSGDGGFKSISQTAEDLFILSRTQSYTDEIYDIALDENYVYWTEYTNTTDSISRVVRIPVALSSTSPLLNGISTDIIYEKQQVGRLRIALDGNLLFISEGDTGDVNVLDLKSGNYINLVSELVSGSGSIYGIPLNLTDNYLYATLSNAEVAEIDKTDGSLRIYPCRPWSDGSKPQADDEGLYWWELDSPNIVLKRLDSLSGVISDVTDIPSVVGSMMIYDFYSDGSRVWWFNYVLNDKVDLQNVYSLGGIPNLIDTYDYDFYCNNGIRPIWITGDNQNVFWGACGKIWRLQKSGGSPSLVTDVSSGTKRIVYNGNFIWANRNEIVKLPKNGVTADPIYEWNHWPQCYVSDNENLYWIGPSYDAVADSEITKLHSMSSKDSSVKELLVFPKDIYGIGIEVNQDTIFFAWGRWIDDFFIISAIPKTGGKVIDLIQVWGNQEVKMSVEKDVLYFLVGYSYNSVSDLYSYDLSKDASLTLMTGLSNAQDIYVDEKYVYWTQAGLSYNSGGVYCIPLKGGIRKTIYDKSRSFEITGDKDYIYWASWEGILRKKK